MTVYLNDLYRGDAVRLVRMKSGRSYRNRTRVAHVYSIVPREDGGADIWIRLRNLALVLVRPDQIEKIRDGNGLMPTEDRPLRDWRAYDRWNVYDEEHGRYGEVTQA